MADPYVSAAELKATLSLTGETFADPDIDVALAAASRGIDKACKRRFWSDADANQVRHYTPFACHLLPIDDLIELTALATDHDGDGTYEQTWAANADFVLEPLNAEVDGEPWTTVRVTGRSSRLLPVEPRSVRVTGRFGWEAVPDEIVQATSVVASKLLKRAREAPFGIVTVGIDVGAAVRIARTDPDVAMLVGPYQRNAAVIA